MRVTFLLSVLALAGCYPVTDELPIEPIGGSGPVPGPDCSLFDLDDSELAPAVEGVAYSGRVRVAEYDGEGVYSLAQGTLPPGVSLFGDGSVTGTPTALGSWDLWIRVQGMTIDDAFGCVQLEVRDVPKGAVLGYVHDQRTWLTDHEGVQQDLWVRIDAVGEEGMDSVLLRPGLYLPGANGVAEAGGGDDELIRLLDPDDVTVEAGVWENADGEPEGSPSTYEGEGLFVAGADTGTLPFTLDHPDFDAVQSKLQVVPPDWCPNGLSSGPGDGSCQ